MTPAERIAKAVFNWSASYIDGGYDAWDGLDDDARKDVIAVAQDALRAVVEELIVKSWNDPPRACQGTLHGLDMGRTALRSLLT